MEYTAKQAKISVVGVGGGGGNAINRMRWSNIHGIELIAMNTDEQALQQSQAHKTIQLGRKLTRGLGAGGKPQVGHKAAQESTDQIADCLSNVDMLFVAAGMGGGTGTGAAPEIAKIARDLRLLTIGIVTLPFSFEGNTRMERANAGSKELAKYVDALISVPNDRLLNITAANLSLANAFELADDILRQGVEGITDLITQPGLINLDFADIESTMRTAGTAMLGIGEGEGEGRIKDASRHAISSPLLETSISGATRVIINIAGGDDLQLQEVSDAANIVRESVSDQADIFFGTSLNSDCRGVKVTVIATGFRRNQIQEKEEFRELAESARSMTRLEKERLSIPAFLRKRDQQWDNLKILD